MIDSRGKRARPVSVMRVPNANFEGERGAFRASAFRFLWHIRTERDPPIEPEHYLAASRKSPEAVAECAKNTDFSAGSCRFPSRFGVRPEQEAQRFFCRLEGITGADLIGRNRSQARSRE